MKTQFKLHDHGQSLVFFVVIAFAILAFIAVIFDGGNAYAMRRTAQNAADAGALAGARTLCLSFDPNTGTVNTAAAIAAAKGYAENNNRATLPNVISQTATASVPTGSVNLVDVDVKIHYNTFFARILGMNQMDAVASAQAGCFPPGGAVGEAVIPMAWKCPKWNTINGQTWCDTEEVFNDLDNKCVVGEDYMYVFFDLEDSTGNIKNAASDVYWCTQWSGTMPIGATPLNCDANGDGQEDIYPITTLNPDHEWTWVNTDGGSCGASEEKYIIEHGLTNPMYVHTWYPGCSGDKTAVYLSIDNFHIGDIVILPVYDKQCPIDPELNQATCGWHTSLDNAVDPGSSSVPWYHLQSFAAFKVTCVDAGNAKCKDNNPPYSSARGALDDMNKNAISNSKKSIEGCFIKDFVPGLIGGGSGGVISGAFTLNLTK
jgi:hypothetical protein